MELRYEPSRMVDMMRCALCDNKDCYTGKDCPGLYNESKGAYTEEDLRSTRISTMLESRYYMKKTRLEELMDYSREMGYGKLGIVFCIGLQEEARVLHRVLEKEFEVHSVCCKVCGIDKDEFGLERLWSEPGERIEAMCNPVGQAKVLEKEDTNLNIILGLCIGHDILFTKCSHAPVTTLAVKDRVLAHNPLGALYSGYYLKNVFKMER